MRKTLLMTTGLAWLALTGAAGAVTVTLTPGPQDPQYFESIAVGESNFTVGTTTWSLVSGNADDRNGKRAKSICRSSGDGRPRPIWPCWAAAPKRRSSPRLRPASASTGVRSMPPGNGILTVGHHRRLYVDRCGTGDDGCDRITAPRAAPTSNELVTISGLGPFTTVDVHLEPNAFEFSLGAAFRNSLDLGDDGPWVCWTRLCRVPPEHEGSGVGDLIASFSKNLQRAAARRPFFFC